MKGCARRLSVYKVLHRLSDVKVTATAAPVSYARGKMKLDVGSSRTDDPVACSGSCAQVNRGSA
jgi:hypothetical protein